jgi:hypothetical protein
MHCNNAATHVLGPAGTTLHFFNIGINEARKGRLNTTVFTSSLKETATFFGP